MLESLQSSRSVSGTPIHNLALKQCTGCLVTQLAGFCWGVLYIESLPLMTCLWLPL